MAAGQPFVAPGLSFSIGTMGREGLEALCGVLGSPSANSCLRPLLIMESASLSGFCISLLAAKLSQTAALL